MPDLICTGCGKLIVKGRIDPSFFEGNPYHWIEIADWFLMWEEVVRIQLGKLVVVAESVGDDYWECLRCGKTMHQGPGGCSNIIQHLYMEHLIARVQVGYNWIGYQEGPW